MPETKCKNYRVTRNNILFERRELKYNSMYFLGKQIEKFKKKTHKTFKNNDQ